MRSLKEIEEEMNRNVPLGNIGKVMDLVDEHGNTTDQMFYAIYDGDLDRICYLEQFGIDMTGESFVVAAVRNDQLMVVANQVRRGCDLPPVDVPIRSGSPGSRLLDGYVG